MVRPADHVRASEAADTPAVVEQSDAVQSGDSGLVPKWKSSAKD